MKAASCLCEGLLLVVRAECMSGNKHQAHKRESTAEFPKHLICLISF